MNDQLKCPHCGATETKSGPFKNKSSLNTHIQIHCPKKPPKDAAAAGGGHQHDWNLLNPRIPSHQRAIEKGYKKICSDKACGEVE